MFQVTVWYQKIHHWLSSQGSGTSPHRSTKQNQVFHVANRAFCGGNWLVIQGCGKSIFHEVSTTQDARRLGVTVLRVKSDSQKSSKI